MASYEPLQPNPGGVVDPDDLVGRTDELRGLLAAVGTGGAYVVGDRRMGKTSLLRKMRDDLEEAVHHVLMVSAETGGLDAFGDVLLRTIRDHAKLGRWWTRWRKEIKGDVTLSIAGQGIHVGGTMSADASVETDLLRLCARAAQEAGAASLVVVIDEIAVLAQLLAGTAPGSAEELLRSLRRVRQDADTQVRVVLAGSVGLHHAISDDTAINDLPRVAVGPLTDQDAFVLAQRLLTWARGRHDDGLALALARECSNIPYYIHQLVSADQLRGNVLSASDVTDRVDRAIDENEWHSDHYVQRISEYFGTNAPHVIELLDQLTHSGPADLDGLSSRLANTFYEASLSRELTAGLLDKLTKDHYLVYDDGTYAWSSTFLRRVWVRTRRRLGP
jgi:hypothetical protein